MKALARGERMVTRHLLDFGRQFRSRLHDRRFWLIQVLVIMISVAHTSLEATHTLGVIPDLYLVPVSTYFIPVVYAGLNFGLEGALPTALWSSLLAVPNIVLFHHGWERMGVAIQLAIMVAVAVLIARRVEQEASAKRRAEAAFAELQGVRESLERYVSLATAAQEEERRRLARELHDDTIQTLVIVKADLDGLAAEPHLSGRARDRLRSVQEDLARAIDEVRRFSRDLRPSLLDDLGLVSALEGLVGDLRTRTGIEAEVSVHGRIRRLDANGELVMYRIIQEALRNVERHSGARRARVRLAFSEATLTASVLDDGTGFDALVPNGTSGHLGLMGMRERAKLADAGLRIRSRPGQGTCISIRLPSPRAGRQVPQMAGPVAPVQLSPPTLG